MKDKNIENSTPDTRSTSDNKNKKSRKVRKGILIGVCIFLGLVLLLGLVAVIYGGSLLNLIGKIQKTDPPSQDEIDQYLADQTETGYTGETVDPNTIVWGDIPNPLETGDGIINILLVGQDRRENEGERARSDAMILCTLNKNDMTLTMTSFMRDMYVQIPGYQDNRINVSYFLGGTELLNETLEYNFGVQVDGNVEVDVYCCIACLDLIGGIEIELTQEEGDYLKRHGNWDYTNDQGWTLTAGMNHLTGTQAVAYSRIRDVGNGDFGRTERQRKVLTVIFEKCKSLSLPELNKLLTQFLPNLTTDMTNTEILGYAWAVFSIMNDLEIQTLRIPADGACSDAWIRDMAVLLPDLEKNRQLLAEVMKVQ